MTESFLSLDPDRLDAPVSWRHPEHPVELLVGRGAVFQLPDGVTQTPVLVVTSRNSVRRSGLEQVFAEQQDWHVFNEVSPNPGPGVIENAARMAKEVGAQTIVGLGGGSALDAARCVSLMVGNASTVQALQSHIREGRPLARTVGLIQVPTTAGTGSEVTPWASVWSEDGQKASVDHPAGFADLAYVDPRLTDTMPPKLTAAVGLDAMTHAMEAIWGRHSDAVSDALAGRALGLLRTHLLVAVSDPNPRARNAVSAGALLAGMALSRTRSAIAHALSYPLTGRYQVAHGLAVGLMAIGALRLSQEDAPAGRERVVRASGSSAASDLAEMLVAVFEGIGETPSLSGLGVPKDSAEELVTTAMNSNRLGNMPGIWNKDRLARLLAEIA